MKQTETYKSLIKDVAKAIKQGYTEDGFESFADMVRDMQMDSQDIKEEILCYAREHKSVAWVDEDGSLTLNDESLEPYPYRSFACAVRKLLK